ncbi:MAG: carboxypeptidase regulatory-like domain-containing protein [Proteobacteria bacterium]|nr:carboxypeptidase regulatory-like domain-containing protein [Pseudomonadota bacterium]
MNAPLIVAGLLALAVLLGSARSWWGLRRAPPAARPRGWRVTLLLLVQAAGAVLLYFVLFPPPQPREAGTLVVLTARSSDMAMQDSAAQALAGEHVVALPEADAPPGTERAPDLATALRRYPATTRLRVLGAGLVARDRDAVGARTLAFHPAPQPRGLAELHAPAQVPAGRRFRITGRAAQLADGAAELLDPAGQRVDRVQLDEAGYFELHGTARSAGPTTFGLRLHDVRAEPVEQVAVPLQVAPARPLRALVLAGAPNPELKYLRRWALDAGIELDTRISLGAGLQIGTAPVALDAATLGGFDLVVLDQRSWRALAAGARAALSTAVEDGLGMLVRMTGPATAADLKRLEDLGFTATAGDAAGETRLGAGFARADEASDAMPGITRGASTITAADGVELLRDAAGAPLASWRAAGRGRIGVSVLDDSYRLVLAGRGEAHGELWSRIFTTLARPGGTAGEVHIPMARSQQRAALCGIDDRARVTAPDGSDTDLHLDPASGPRRCAGFWPESAGWHLLRAGAEIVPFYVRDPGEAPGLQAHAVSEATLALAGGRAGPAANAAGAAQTAPGPRWPWFLAWLLLASAGWWLERSRLGLPRSAPRTA